MKLFSRKTLIGALAVFGLVSIVSAFWFWWKWSEVQAANALEARGAFITWRSQVHPDGSAELFNEPQGLKRFFGSVVRVDFTSEHGDDDLQMIAPLKSLTAVSIARSRCSDAGTSIIQELKDLTVLNADDTAITDVTLRHVRALDRLRTLSVAGTRVTDDGLKPVVSRVEYLDVSRTAVQGLVFADGRQLRRLTIIDSPITKTGWAAIANLTHLEMLDATRVTLCEEAINSIASLPSLRFVGLADTGLTDEQLRALAKLPNLEEIDIRGTNVTDAGFEALAACKNLQAVDIGRTRITSQAAATMKRKHPDLRFLDSEPDAPAIEIPERPSTVPAT